MRLRFLLPGFLLAAFLCPVRAQVPYVSTAEDIALGGLVLQDLAAAADRVHFLKNGKIVASHDTPGHDPAEISRLYLETYK